MDVQTPASASIARPTSWLGRARALAERLAVAHFVGYPLAFVWAVAAIPLTIHLSIGAIDQLDGDMSRIGDLIVRRVAWPAGGAFAAAHVMAIPWLVAADPKVGQRRTLLGLAGLGVLGVVFGGVSWLWLMLR